MSLSSGALRRALRSGALAALAVLLSLAGSAALSPASAQRTCDCARMAVASTRDTAFTFSVENRPDVKAGRTGVVLDPRRRDALVATFVIARIDRGVATAVVTGQTTDIATTHVAMLDQPKPSVLRSSRFWIGLVVGVLVGAAAGAAL